MDRVHVMHGHQLFGSVYFDESDFLPESQHGRRRTPSRLRALFPSDWRSAGLWLGLWVNCALVCAEALEQALAALSPDVSDSASIRVQRPLATLSDEAVRAWITYAILVGFWAHRLTLVHCGDGRCGASSPVSLLNDWTAAASRDIFLETSRITKASQTLAFFYCLITASILLLTNVVNLDTAKFHGSSLALSSDTEDSASMLRSFVVFDKASRVLSLCFNGFMMSITQFIPISLYSAVTWEAVKLTGDHRLRAILRGHWLAFPAVLCGLAQLALYTHRAMSDRPIGKAELVATITLGSCLAVYQIAVSLWLVRVPGPREVLHWCHRLSHKVEKAVIQKKKRIESRMGSSLSHKEFQQIQGSTSMTEVSGVMRTRDAGTQLRRNLLLVFVLISFSFSSYASSYFQTAGIFMYRVVLMVLLFLTRDEVVNEFTQLRRGHGAGFGLVVDAAHLRKALLSHIAGKRYEGPLGKYKASLYRMINTMAVSYRWQEGETDIGNGLSLNMSPWQLKSLLAALEGNPVQYVWIDRVSVPQTRRRSAMQKMLLARMMAVYSSARITLCLRSIEPDGSRYHQRAWTLQEYCAGKQLLVFTQTCSAHKLSHCLECGEIAVAGDEEDFFHSFRVAQVYKAHKCSPFWLYGVVSQSLDVPDAMDVMDKFYELQERVHCSDPTDKIRSLYPMLANTPVESHADLGRLVKLVSRIVVSSWGLSTNESEWDETTHSGTHRLHGSIMMARQSMMCLRDWDSIYNDEASFKGVRRRTGGSPARGVGRSMSVGITAMDPAVLTNLDYELPGTPSSDWESSLIPTTQPGEEHSSSEGGVSPVFGTNKWESTSVSASHRSVASETGTDGKPGLAAMFWSHRLAPLVSKGGSGMVAPSLTTDLVSRTASDSQSFSRLRELSITVRQDTLSGTGSAPDTNFRQGPAEVRVMETLVSPSAESGWSRRDTYTNRPLVLRSSFTSEIRPSTMDQNGPELV